MARKKSSDSPPPSKAYLVSFGDTMTTLLAFFIVLCSLAEEQTGANLHRGTGSFVRAVDSYGLPGMFSGERSSNAIPRNETSPLYIADDPEGREPDKNPTGPDAEDNGVRVIDREAEEFQRFLNEMERFFPSDRLPQTKGQVTFDFFNRLRPEPPLLPAAFDNVLPHVAAALRKRSHRVEVIVWATTPSESAWLRATDQASTVAREIADRAALDAADRDRLLAVGKPWIDSKSKRPVFSIVVRKLDLPRR